MIAVKKKSVPQIFYMLGEAYRYQESQNPEELQENWPQIRFQHTKITPNGGDNQKNF